MVPRQRRETLSPVLPNRTYGIFIVMSLLPRCRGEYTRTCVGVKCGRCVLKIRRGEVTPQWCDERDAINSCENGTGGRYDEKGSAGKKTRRNQAPAVHPRHLQLLRPMV